MTQRPPDKSSFDSYLAGDSPQSTAYQQSTTDGPSGLTDARILAAARESVRNANAGAATRARYRWMVPTALAATLVVTVSIVLVMQHTQEIVPAAPIQLAEQDITVIAKAEPVAAPPAPMASEAPRSTPARHNIELKQDKLAANTTPPAKPQAKLREPAMEIAQAPAAAPVAESAPAGMVTDQAPAESRDVTSVGAIAANEGLARAKTEKQAETREYAEQQKLKKSASKPAEAWLEEINKLLKDGKEQLARDELKAFRAVYPRHVIDAKRYPEILKLEKTGSTTLKP